MQAVAKLKRSPTKAAVQLQKATSKIMQTKNIVRQITDFQEDPQFLEICIQVNCNYQTEPPIIVEAIKTVSYYDSVREEFAG